MSKNLEALVGLQAAYALRERFGSLHSMAACEAVQYESVPGIGPVKAAQLKAAFDLGREALRGPAGKTITGVPAALALLADMRGLQYEELRAIYVDRRQHVLAVRTLTQGSDAFTIVDPRQVFRPAVTLGASAVVLAHNHPSGDPTPSSQDRDVTRRCISAGRILGIQLLDHIIVAGQQHTSLAGEGFIPNHYTGTEGILT